MIVWVSDCGKYYAMPFRDRAGFQEHDVFTIDGQQCWRGKRYIPKGFDDKDPRFLCPEFAHMVDGWHFERKKNGQIEFTLTFCDTNPNIKIIPFTGNAVLKSYKATFRKKKAIRKAILPIYSEV